MLEIYEDHITIEDSIAIMRVPYFLERLQNLPSFSGFVPRWYFPAEKLRFSKSNTTAIITAMIIDSRQEIKVGVGYDWPPVILGPDEMQL